MLPIFSVAKRAAKVLYRTEPPTKEEMIVTHRLLCMLLALCLALSLFPLSALAAEGGSCGERVRWTLEGDTLTISGTGPMADYAQRVLPGGGITSDAPWTAAKDGIRRVVVASGVTSVGSRAFSGLAALESVTLPDSVKTIGVSAFSGSGLKSLVLPRALDSIGESAFGQCASLDTVTMPERLGNIGRFAFSHAEALKTLVIPAGVETIPEYLFSTNWQLESVVLPATVKTIESEAFYACAALRHVWFAGTEAQWKAVRVGAPRDPSDSLYTALQHAEIHFGDPAARFSDTPRDWALPYITGAAAEGIMNGTGEHTFEPNAPLTRGMVVTILWRLCGEPQAAGESPFRDLTQPWYRQAVAWAAETGVVRGVSAAAFEPEKSITRQDFVTILYRYAQSRSDDLGLESLRRFTDEGSVADYAYEPMAWAVGAGVISGIPTDSGVSLSPGGTATRAQAAKMFLVYRSVV